MKITQNKKLGFTLVEMVVTVGILGMVLAMTSGMINYSVGKLRSARAKLLNDTIRNSFDIIAQKMYNANDSIGSGTSSVYGFTVYKGSGGSAVMDQPSYTDTENPIILIISSGDDPIVKTCTYFGKKDSKIMMYQQTCPGAAANYFISTNQLTSSLTSDKIKVTNFTITSTSSVYNATRPDDKIPFFELNVEAQEIQDSKNTSQLKTTFTMDYENLNNKLPEIP